MKTQFTDELYLIAEAMNNAGRAWHDIAADLTRGELTGDALRKRVRRWQGSQRPELPAPPDRSVLDAPDEKTDTRIFTERELVEIRSREKLLEVFEIDEEKWSVTNFTVNSWQQHSEKAGTVTLYQVKATLVPIVSQDYVRAIEADIAQMIEDAAAHAPAYPKVIRVAPTQSPLSDERHLMVMSIRDPHIGMLAWGKEVGRPYDTDIAIADYGKAVNKLLRYAGLYPVEKILFLLGDDFYHVDGPAPATRGSNRGGATTAGTAQDVDTRLAKLFTMGRRAAVAALDQARLIAPVDAIVVPGNHGAQSEYKLGEVLSAWYRRDDDVNIIYSPNKRKFYGWEKNAFMFTHGEEYRRKRDSLPLIFATEAPADIWVASEGGSREIHTGHNHIYMQGGYYPTAEVNETRQVRTRSLPGLTPEDAWHHEEGYKHKRAAMVLFYTPDGTVAGVHEVTP